MNFPALTNWSFSKLMSYESCPLRVKFRYVDKAPELPPRADSPLERGNREHDRYERFVKGDNNALATSEARGIGPLRPAFDQLQALHSIGQASAEEDWIYNQDWDRQNDRSGYWLWAKLDAFAWSDDGVCVAIDFKTGKSAYKVIEHKQQLQLYAALAALRDDNFDTIIAENWYTDEGLIVSSEYTRDQALMYVGRFQSRVDKMLSDTVYRPNPTKQTCHWCPYGPKNGTGFCPVGV